MNRQGAKFVSLFSGAGGLDLGLEMAGWQTAYASDADPAAVETLKANAGTDIGGGRKAFEHACLELADVRTLRATDILAKSGAARGDIQFLAGGPPCQSWSSAGHQLGFDDPRGRLFDDFVRLAAGLDVRWLMAENVRGLLTARGPDGQPGSALEHIRKILLKSGFQTNIALLNAADFGVPQRRVRLFIIGYRVGDAPPFPALTHMKQPVGKAILDWVPLSGALARTGSLDKGEIIRPSGKLAQELEGIAPGSGVKSPGKAERTRPGGHWGYKQGAFVADPARPARTVTASAQQDWIRDPVEGLRRLCSRECAAIQSFPPEWKFAGNLAAKYRLIGNAVSPLLAKAIGGKLLDFTEQSQKATAARLDMIVPLPEKLAGHIRYTAREEASNGKSRREAPRRRQTGAALAAR